MRVKRKVAIAGAALAVAALAGGGAYAATQSSPTESRQAFLSDVAKRLGIPESKLASAVQAAEIDQLDAAVKAGMLTQARANAIAKRIEHGAIGPAWLGRRPGPGPAGRGGFFRAAGPLAAAAGYLGLTPPQLRTQLQSGKTLAQIAGARGKSTSGLQQAMVASAKSQLDRARTRGRITSAQEKQILGTLSGRIADEISGKAPRAGFLGHLGFRGHWGPGGPGGAGAPGGPNPPGIPRPGAFDGPGAGAAPGPTA